MLTISRKPLAAYTPTPLRLTPNRILHPRDCDREKWGNAVNADGAMRCADRAAAMLDARQIVSLTETLASLPGPGQSIHMVIGHAHSMGHLLPAILNLSQQTITRCHIATLTFSMRNAEDWCAMLEAGKIGSLTVICSHWFSKTSPKIYEKAVPMLERRGATVAALRCHAKILLCRLADGRTITAEGSANTRSAKTIEQLAIFGSPEIYAFHAGWIDSLTEVQQ